MGILKAGQAGVCPTRLSEHVSTKRPNLPLRGGCASAACGLLSRKNEKIRRDPDLYYVTKKSAFRMQPELYEFYVFHVCCGLWLLKDSKNLDFAKEFCSLQPNISKTANGKLQPSKLSITPKSVYTIEERP